MHVKLGDRTQFYGETSDPAQASSVQHDVFSTLKKAGLQLTPVYTGVRGPDVWFEIADKLVEQLEEFVKTLPQIGTPYRVPDELVRTIADDLPGEYLYLPLILQKRERRRRR